METPQDLDAERQVLGALLLRPDLIIQTSSLIVANDFYMANNRVIYEAILTLQQSGEEDLDPLRIIHYLRDRDVLENAGGDMYIMRLAQDVISPTTAPVHARRIKNLALRRDIIEAAANITEDASTPFEDETEFLKKVEDRILKITNASYTEGLVHVRDVKDEFTAYIQKLIENKGMLSGQLTHFDGFDELTAGLKGGQLLILAARPGMGKTTFAMNVAANIAQMDKKHVVVYSLEMSKMELLMRMVCATAQFSSQDLKRGNIPQGRTQDILKGINDVFESPLHIDDSGTLDIFDCMLRTRKLAIELAQQGGSLGLIVIDYLQLLSDPESRKMGRQQEVATISRSLKQLAKMLDVPVLALSQMNRSVEQRKGDAKPQLSDLRESGAIEQDADVVMFIHRDQFDDEDSPEALENRGTAEVILAKHRAGPVGSFRVAFRPELSRFDNVAVVEDQFQ